MIRSIREYPIQQAQPFNFELSPGPDGCMKIAIVMTGSFGDNINSTLMLAPLRAYFPDCQLDVYSTTLYGSAFDNLGSYISNLIKMPARSKDEVFDYYDTRKACYAQLEQQLKLINYEYVLKPAPITLFPESERVRIDEKKRDPRGSNLIYCFVRALDKIKVPIEPPYITRLELTANERRRASQFVPRSGCRNVLMEVEALSGQSFWSQDWTLAVCRHLLRNGGTKIYISRKDWLPTEEGQLQREFGDLVLWVGQLSLRECAEIFNKCDVFFSVSSGLANVCNTNYCKEDIKWVEVTGRWHDCTAPIRDKGRIFWREHDLPRFLGMLKDNGI